MTSQHYTSEESRGTGAFLQFSQLIDKIKIKMSLKSNSRRHLYKTSPKERWISEYNIAVRLIQQNIVKYMDAMRTRDRELLFFIMEYCCKTVANHVEQSGMSVINIERCFSY